MTESELVEAAAMFYALVGDNLSLYLTATSGFLLVAYLVGDKLTALQMSVVSVLYVVFASVSAYLSIGYGVRGMGYTFRLKQMNPEMSVYAHYAVPSTLGVVLLGGIIACLIFMWQVRHPKKE